MNNFENNFFDLSHFNEKTKETPIEQKLSALHENMGGLFWDREKELMTGSVAKIISVGGFPVTLNKERLNLLGVEVSKQNILDAVSNSSGSSAFMSYLNPAGYNLQQLGNLVLNKHKHLSVLHTFTIGVLLSGISIGVENEFSCQRDIVHLSRVTVAKTKAQDNPCLVCRNEKIAHIYKNVLHYTKHQLIENDEFLDDKEERNLLFPTAKASAVILTGSLKDMLKLVQLANSGGKEDEFVDALKKIEKIINNVFDI